MLNFFSNKYAGRSDLFKGLDTWKDMDEEDLLDMFVNGEGICMGSGQVWLNDPGYMTDEEPKLEIIAINGIVDRNAESDEAAADEEKDKEKTEEKTEEKQENESSNGSERPEREEDFYFNTAGWNACPTGGQIIKEIAPLLGVSIQDAVKMPDHIQSAYDYVQEKKKKKR